MILNQITYKRFLRSVLNGTKHIIVPSSLILFLGCNQLKQKKFVLTRVRSVAKLATTQVVLNKIVWSEFNEKRFLRKLFITDRNNVIILNTSATVKLGIDLKKLSQDNIHINPDSTVIVLPPVEILNFSYPHESYEEVFPISNFDQCKVSDKVEQLDEMLRLAEKNIRAQLNFLNLTEEVKNKTTKVLSHFLAKNNFQNIIIRFEE